jgi:adenylyltransferase/sulfurtransferase
MKIDRETALVDRNDRYHRQRLIGWWDQQRVASARILVVGAGALGNEVLKSLALTGAGNLLVFDIDRIERSNLSRAVLFREADEGRLKAEVAAGRLGELNPEIRAVGRAADVTTAAGLGLFAWADVVIGAVDNREARVFINAACAATGTSWVDGGTEGLAGVVRAFSPGESACYECTMNATDRRILAERRSCAMLARQAAARGHVPTTAVSSSVIAGLQVAEAIKILHDQPALIGEGLHIDGLWSQVSRVAYPRRDECPGHDHLGPLIGLGLGVADLTVGALLDRAERDLGAGAVIDLSREVATALRCPECEARSPGGGPLGAISEADAACAACGAHRIVDFTSSLGRDTPVPADWTLARLGVPSFDIIVARRGLDRRQAWLLDGDVDAALGPLAESWRSERPGE